MNSCDQFTSADWKPDWRLGPHPLKFQLGDKTLFSVPMNVLACKIDLALGGSANVAPPPGSLDKGGNGYLIRSLPVESRLPVVSRFGDYLRYAPSQFSRFYADLNQTFEDYARKFSAKTRYNLNRSRRKFVDHCGGTLSWKVYKRADEISEFYRLARAVSTKTYQEKLLDAGLPEGDNFLQKLQAQASANAMRGYLLFNGEDPVSYIYCSAQETTLVFQYLGYDPAYRDWSVGTILQWLALEDLFAEKTFRYFDFNEGESDYKRLFSTHHIQCANVYFLRDSLGNRALVKAHHLTNRFSSWIGSILARLGLKARIRKLLRRA